MDEAYYLRSLIVVVDEVYCRGDDGVVFVVVVHHMLVGRRRATKDRARLGLTLSEMAVLRY